jgi:IS30 family transposase
VKVDRPWTYPEVCELRRLIAARLTYYAIGRRLGRSKSAISSRAYRLGVRTRAAVGQHDDTVRRLVRAGWHDWEIALEIDRSRSTVQDIRTRLKLPPADKARSAAARAKHKVTA